MLRASWSLREGEVLFILYRLVLNTQQLHKLRVCKLLCFLWSVTAFLQLYVIKVNGTLRHVAPALFRKGLLGEWVYLGFAFLFRLFGFGLGFWSTLFGRCGFGFWRGTLFGSGFWGSLHDGLLRLGLLFLGLI